MPNCKYILGNQLHDIVVYVSKKKNVGRKKKDRKHVCGKYTGPADTGERVYIVCDTPMVGKYVTVYKTAEDKKENLSLCEVFVSGIQSKN